MLAHCCLEGKVRGELLLCGLESRGTWLTRRAALQDIEFTVEEGQLWMLQCRNGKRTGHAAIAVATALVDEGLVSKARAISKLVEPRHLAQLLHPQFEAPEAYKKDVIGTGMPASPGAAGAPLPCSVCVRCACTALLMAPL